MADLLPKTINWAHWNFRIPDPEDQKKVIARFRKSGARSRSDFARAALLKEDIRIVSVDSSFIDAVNAFSHIVADIYKLGVNYNQITKVINTYHSEPVARRLLEKVEQSHLDLFLKLQDAIDIANELKDGKRSHITTVTAEDTGI